LVEKLWFSIKTQVVLEYMKEQITLDGNQEATKDFSYFILSIVRKA